LLAVVLFVIVSGYIVVNRGFSARELPTAGEAFVARTARRLATPAAMRKVTSPFKATPEVLAEARAHFADHCAICHGNNGSGQTTIGKNMYPKPPDMRQRQTQELTDGEIYSIIHNGIRLTGMPAWGAAEDDQDSWSLVLFIRHLPQLTAAEEEEMEALNPKSPEEIREEQEEQQFLNEQQPSPPAPRQKSGSRH
jgi:mono/diheme cytochrome c family protein